MCPHKCKKTSGFTLVEILIVMTLLVILSTIGFVVHRSYFSSARDSQRVANITSIADSLDVYGVSSGEYPLPDKNFAITYSGGGVWNQ